MKYATTELTVQPGQMVEIVLTNPDQLQHNFVLGAPGSLQIIGAAADQFATTAGCGRAGLRPGYRAGAVQDEDGRRGTVRDVPVPRAGDAWRLSVSLHVSESLAHHERRAARDGAWRPRPRRGADAGAGKRQSGSRGTLSRNDARERSSFLCSLRYNRGRRLRRVGQVRRSRGTN